MFFIFKTTIFCTISLDLYQSTNKIYHINLFRSIRAKEVKVDSKVISFKVRVNPDPNNTDQLMNQKSYAQNCVPDEDIMKYKPVRMTFFHYDVSTSKRKLLWHDGDAKTGVSFINCLQ